MELNSSAKWVHNNEAWKWDESWGARLWESRFDSIWIELSGEQHQFQMMWGKAVGPNLREIALFGIEFKLSSTACQNKAKQYFLSIPSWVGLNMIKKCEESFINELVFQVIWHMIDHLKTFLHHILAENQIHVNLVWRVRWVVRFTWIALELLTQQCTAPNAWGVGYGLCSAVLHGFEVWVRWSTAWGVVSNERWVGTTNSLLTGGTISRTFENWAIFWARGGGI